MDDPHAKLRDELDDLRGTLESLAIRVARLSEELTVERQLRRELEAQVDGLEDRVGGPP